MSDPFENGGVYDEQERFNSLNMNELTDGLEQRGFFRDLAGKQYGLVVLGGQDPASELARKVEYGVFNDTFGNSYPVMQYEYGPYDLQSTFVLAIDMPGWPIPNQPYSTRRLAPGHINR